MTGYIRFQRTYLFRHFINSRWAVAFAANAIEKAEGLNWFLIRWTGWLWKWTTLWGVGGMMVGQGGVIGCSLFIWSREDLWLNYCPNYPGLLWPGYQGLCCSTGLWCENHWCRARWDCQNVSIHQAAKRGYYTVDFRTVTPVEKVPIQWLIHGNSMVLWFIICFYLIESESF